jgi:hypothetical protein
VFARGVELAARVIADDRIDGALTRGPPFLGVSFGAVAWVTMRLRGGAAPGDGVDIERAEAIARSLRGRVCSVPGAAQTSL